MINFRLKTTAYTGTILKNLHNSMGLTPNILARIALSLSLLEKELPEPVKSESGGLEFNRNTLTGEQDFIYKSLVKQHYGAELEEEEYFPDLFNAHLTRGVLFLEQEYKYSGNYEKLLAKFLFDAKENMEGI